MTVRRIGLSLAVVLCLLALVPALDIAPDPRTGEVGIVPIAALVLNALIAAVTLALVVPAWRGRRTAGTIIAVLQLASTVTALPAFFAPEEVVPPGGVIAATVGTLAAIAVFAMIVFDAPRIVLQALALLAVIALFSGTVALLGLVVPTPAMRLTQTVAAAACAAVFPGILRLLRATVGRALYGGRADPERTALALAGSVHHGEDAVASAVTGLAQSLRLPRLELCAPDGTVLAAGTGSARAGTHTAEMQLEDGRWLRVTLRPGERTLQRDDARALRLVAVPLDLLARESRLLDEVRAARAGVVDARGREQRALHRDLHDGLGPLLTGAVMRADAAQNLIRIDPAAARAELDSVRTDLRTAIAEVRRVVYGLWPVELEQRGFGEALRLRAERAGAVGDFPDHLPPLAPAVERAAYRIAGEALTNAERHGAPGTIEMTLTLTADAVSLRVVNEVVAGARSRGAGVGIASMRARAEELGGTVTTARTPERWSVEALLPRHPGGPGVLGADTDAVASDAVHHEVSG